MAKKPNKTKREQTREWRYVHITIAGKNLDPEKVTKVLGILPDNQGKLGEPCGKNRKCKQGYWSLEGGPTNWRIETQMEHILKRIRPVKNKLKKFIEENDTVREAVLKIAFAPPEGIPNPGCKPIRGWR